MSVVVGGPVLGQGAAGEGILRALPDWFGIEEAIIQYRQAIDRLPTLLAYDGEQVVGFLSLKQHNPYAAEIYVMAILPEMHRRGIGRALVGAAEEHLRDNGTQYLQVKTLSPSHPDPNYARTRAFYLAMGFRPLEEFKTLWDAHNPALLMVKCLTAATPV
jgi:ribosomal protein S18 acetylase RimI-like enzyme